MVVSQEHIFPLYWHLGFGDWFDLTSKLINVKRQGSLDRYLVRTTSMEELVQKGKEQWNILPQEPVRLMLSDFTALQSSNYNSLQHYNTVVLLQDGEAIDCKNYRKVLIK